MKKLKLKVIAILLFGVIHSSYAMAVIVNSYDKMKNCEFTRLGCVKDNSSKIQKDWDPTINLSIGLDLKIKCQTKDADGEKYLVDLKLVKKIDVKENQSVNYYLIEGVHGDLEYSVIKAENAGPAESIMEGYFSSSKISQYSIPKWAVVSATFSMPTRAGSLNEETKLYFSDISNPAQNSIFKLSAIKKTTEKFMGFNSELPSLSNIEILKFVESSCSYY